MPAPTILIIDDDLMVRELTRLMLEQKGCKVLEAESGEAACEIFTSAPKQVDLVFLDLTMPGMSGEETLGALRKLNGNVRVVVTSGCESEATSPSGEKPNGYLHKPFQINELFDTIDNQLRC